MPTILLNGSGGFSSFGGDCGMLLKTEDSSLAGPTGYYNWEVSLDQAYEIMWRIRDGNVVAPLGLATSRIARATSSFPFVEPSDVSEFFCSSSFIYCAPPNENICAQYEFYDSTNNTTTLVVGGMQWEGIYQYNSKYYPALSVEFLHWVIDDSSPLSWPDNAITYGYLLQNYRAGAGTKQLQITNSSLPPITLYAQGEYGNPSSTPSTIVGNPELGSIEITRYFTWGGVWNESTGQKNS